MYCTYKLSFVGYSLLVAFVGHIYGPQFVGRNLWVHFVGVKLAGHTQVVWMCGSHWDFGWSNCVGHNHQVVRVTNVLT